MNFKEPLTEIVEEKVGFVVYQLGGPQRVGLYGCTTRNEALAFIAGLRANDGGAYKQGYALGQRREYARWIAMLNKCGAEPFDEDP